jgi:hypothetical protein
MRVRIGRSRGLGKAIEQSRKTERVKVGKRKRVGQSGTIRRVGFDRLARATTGFATNTLMDVGFAII